MIFNELTLLPEKRKLSLSDRADFSKLKPYDKLKSNQSFRFRLLSRYAAIRADTRVTEVSCVYARAFAPQFDGM